MLNRGVMCRPICTVWGRLWLSTVGQTGAAALRCALPSSHPSTGTQPPMQPEHFSSMHLTNRFCTKIDRFINVCVIIHSFTRAQSWLTSSRWKMTYCCCSRTSFEYLGEGGRGVQTWWKGLLAFTDTWWYFMKQHTLHVQAGSCTAIISERMSISNLCAIEYGTAGYLTGDRRLRFKGLHIQIHQSTNDDQAHRLISDLSCFIFILYETVSQSQRTAPLIQRPTHPYP